MSCTTWKEDWGLSGLNGPYDESDVAYDSATITYDKVLYTGYTEDASASTSYTEDSDASTAFTEDWAITVGTYDDSAEAYDSAENTYDGIYFTVWTEDTDDAEHSYLPIGLCIEMESTSGELLLDTGGDNLEVNSL